MKTKYVWKNKNMKKMLASHLPFATVWDTVILMWAWQTQRFWWDLVEILAIRHWSNTPVTFGKSIWDQHRYHHQTSVLVPHLRECKHSLFQPSWKSVLGLLDCWVLTFYWWCRGLNQNILWIAKECVKIFSVSEDKV